MCYDEYRSNQHGAFGTYKFEWIAEKLTVKNFIQANGLMLSVHSHVSH